MSRIQFDARPDRKVEQVLSVRAAAQAYAVLAEKRALIPCSGKFTHKCKCPSPDHKNGQESTASFYFSKDTGQFYCFGCSIYGNALDLLAMLANPEDAQKAVFSAFGDGAVEIQSGPSARQVAEKQYRMIVRCARTLLRSNYGTPGWSSFFDWMQKFYIRLDAVLRATADNDTQEAVYGRFLQLKAELKQRASR